MRKQSSIIRIAGVAALLALVAGVSYAQTAPAKDAGATLEVKLNAPSGRGAKADGNQNEAVRFSGADEGEYLTMSSGDQIVILRGNIKMEMGAAVISAKVVVYNKNTGDITITDELTFSDGENVIVAQKGVFNVQTKTGVLYGARSTREPLLFQTDKIRIVGEKKYVAEGMGFSTCELERPHYLFRVSKIWIYNDRRVVASNAIYVVGDIPLFYFPVIVHSDEGIGIIMQFGFSNRRGEFLQNTVRYTTEGGFRWKFKLDIYKKMGYYGGIELMKKTDDFDINLYVSGARYKPVDENLEISASLPDENWYKAALDSNMRFLYHEWDTSHMYYNLKFEWMNNWDYERNYDNRREPVTAVDMILFVPRNVFDVRRYLYWNFALGHRGDRHNVMLLFKRTWMWNETLDPKLVDDYYLKGLYAPLYDQLPQFTMRYNGSFRAFEKKDEKTGETSGQTFNWNVNLSNNYYKEYLLGNFFRATNTLLGSGDINTVFPFWTYFAFTPGMKAGFSHKHVEDPNDATRPTSELEARKNSYLFLEPSARLKFGTLQYYLQAGYVYRRTFLESETVEPFVHERLNYLEGGLYLFPLEGIDMSVTTTYDVRPSFPFEDERWRDVVVKNNFFFDFFSYLKSDAASNRKKNLFFAGIGISNSYQYIARDSESGYNTFDIAFMTGNFSIMGIRLFRNIELGYNWFHDFRHPFRDIMGFRWNVTAELSKWWRLDIGMKSQADSSYLYTQPNTTITPYEDMQKSLYFFNQEKSKGAVFTLRDFHVDLLHDLHCWEIGISYNIERSVRKVGPYNRDRVIYYEQMVFLTFRLKSFSGAGGTGQVYGSKREWEY